MFSKELRKRARRVFEKRYKRKLTDGEIDLILRQSVRFVKGLR